MNILLPSLFRLHCIMGPAGVIPNMNLIESLAEHARIDIWSMIPSLVDELGETPDVLAKFKSSKFICASGGEHIPSISMPTPNPSTFLHNHALTSVAFKVPSVQLVLAK